LGYVNRMSPVPDYFEGSALLDAQGAKLIEANEKLAQVAARRADLFFCVGTSAIVQPAASLTDLAVDAGATTVQVNPNSTGIEERVTFALRGPAGTLLPALLERSWPC
jgi:NAD-dependent deacetylase